LSSSNLDNVLTHEVRLPTLDIPSHTVEIVLEAPLLTEQIDHLHASLLRIICPDAHDPLGKSLAASEREEVRNEIPLLDDANIVETKALDRTLTIQWYFDHVDPR
jgi:hypothetical protein